MEDDLKKMKLEDDLNNYIKLEWRPQKKMDDNFKTQKWKTTSRKWAKT